MGEHTCAGWWQTPAAAPRPSRLGAFGALLQHQEEMGAQGSRERLVVRSLEPRQCPLWSTLCRTGTHCCQPPLCQTLGAASREQLERAGEQRAEISLGRAGRKGFSILPKVHQDPDVSPVEIPELLHQLVSTRGTQK